MRGWSGVHACGVMHMFTRIHLSFKKTVHKSREYRFDVLMTLIFLSLSSKPPCECLRGPSKADSTGQVRVSPRRAVKRLVINWSGAVLYAWIAACARMTVSCWTVEMLDSSVCGEGTAWPLHSGV